MELESKQCCTARLDRLRIVGGFSWPAQLPTVRHFTTISDSFVRAQTSVRTYLRCRRIVHRRNGTQIFWQYAPQPAWLKLRPWRITFIADDSRGLWPSDLEPVLSYCGPYSILLVELAVDFHTATGVDKTFVHRHGLFGKSRPRLDRGGVDQLRYGTRASDKLVRAYPKPTLDAFRVELEAHRGILRRAQIDDLINVPKIARVLIPSHFRFVGIEWAAIRWHLLDKFGRRGPELLARTKAQSYSIHRALRYLRECGVNNVHRFLATRQETGWAKDSVARWAVAFGESPL